MLRRPPSLAVFAILTISLPTAAAEEAPSFHVGARLQTWYQAVEHAAADESTSHEFMIRRAYVYVLGRLPSNVSLFAHIGGDRIGQQGLDNPGLGLGSGVALRDAWIAWEPDPALHVQVGRMCVPFTRAFGTESAFTLASLDVPFSQGGTRGALFYTSKLGRDDGLVLWGTPLKGRMQYRFGVMEGVEGTGNPSDSIRIAGRLILSLLEPETTWGNRGTYLGTKRVLAFGVGLDRQNALSTSSVPAFDSRSWTADVFFDHPVHGGGVTVEAAFTDIHGLTQPMAFAGLAPGADAHVAYAMAGYLVPRPLGTARLQAYGRFETIDGAGDTDTTVPALGASLLLRGQDFKTTAEWSRMDRTGARVIHVATIQVQIAF